MKEDFLHYLWKFKKIPSYNISTTEGDSIQIIDYGIHNKDSGPDFLNSRIKIGNTLWVGNIEIHIKASDWNKHQHQYNKAYQNVILHVVFEHDKDIFYSNGNKIPTLCIKKLIPDQEYNIYNQFINTQLYIPCEKYIHNVSDLIIDTWLERLLIERLENKITPFESVYQETISYWDEIVYLQLANTFGLKINLHNFQRLSELLPYSIIKKNTHDLFILETLLFGVAGFLSDNIDDEYYLNLKKEFEFQRKKYNLSSMKPHEWKFSKLRPSNFPTLRIAQWAQFLYQINHLSNYFINLDLNHYFSLEIIASTYWDNRYTFNKLSSKTQSKKLGRSFMNTILINAVCPFLIFYGKKKGDESLINKALNVLEQIPTERNGTIQNLQNIGFKTKNASHSQSLLQLYKKYCIHKKCLNCNIGINILKQSS